MTFTVVTDQTRAGDVETGFGRISCNVALMQIGSAIGKEQFVRYQQLFGFGQSTGIDLPGEAAGLLYSLDDMDSSTLATNAFGQNFNVTMTQLAASFVTDQRRKLL